MPCDVLMSIATTLLLLYATYYESQMVSYYSTVPNKSWPVLCAKEDHIIYINIVYIKGGKWGEGGASKSYLRLDQGFKSTVKIRCFENAPTLNLFSPHHI